MLLLLFLVVKRRLQRKLYSLEETLACMKEDLKHRNIVLADYVKMSKLIPAASHTVNLRIANSRVNFLQKSQPDLIFEKVIRKLFKQFLSEKKNPVKIALSFRILPEGQRFYIPLRLLKYNTYNALSREVERHVQSQHGGFQIAGLQVDFKLTAQYLPRNQSTLVGACRRLKTSKMRSEIDVSNSKNRFCLVYSILAGIKMHTCTLKNKNKMEVFLHEWAVKKNLEKRAIKLLQKAGCSTTKRYYDLEDCDRIQTYLNKCAPKTFRIVIVESTKFVYKAPIAKFCIAIRLFQKHFTLIQNVSHFFGVRFEAKKLAKKSPFTACT